jgi:nitrous oxide reductase
MPGLTRRQLLGKSLGAATAGAALVGGAAVVPKLLASAGGQASRPSADSVARTLVVHVRPGNSGELRVISGEREAVISDAQLVSRLRSASPA